MASVQKINLRSNDSMLNFPSLTNTIFGRFDTEKKISGLKAGHKVLILPKGRDIPYELFDAEKPKLSKGNIIKWSDENFHQFVDSVPEQLWGTVEKNVYGELNVYCLLRAVEDAYAQKYNGQSVRNILFDNISDDTFNGTLYNRDKYWFFECDS